MTPLRFRPLVKRARWGGTQLGSLLGKPTGGHADSAESWEFSDHGRDQSVVDGGPLDGLTLHELIQQHNAELLGQHQGLKQFPLLVKFLDAQDRLSLQVHPSDIQVCAFEPGENGKTEAWVILSAAPGARVFTGLKLHVDQFRFEQHLRAGTVEECLHAYEVHAGDCIFIPAGTVHAIGEGIVLAEVQQSSDMTFRISDWGRLGADGQPRELHIEESLVCTDFDRGPVNPVVPRSLVSLRESATSRYETEELVACEYFVLHRHRGTTAMPLLEHDCFHALLVLSGNGHLACGDEQIPLQLGTSVLVPADCDDVLLVPNDELTVLDAFLPTEPVPAQSLETVETRNFKFA